LETNFSGKYLDLSRME